MSNVKLVQSGAKELASRLGIQMAYGAVGREACEDARREANFII